MISIPKSDRWLKRKTQTKHIPVSLMSINIRILTKSEVYF